VIRAYGILNETVSRDSYVYGVPYPGVYVLDAHGVVTAKYFEDNYAERVTASDILVRQFGASPAVGAAVEGPRVRVAPSCSARQAVGGQKVALVVDLDIRTGVHLYAPGVTGYKSVAWEMSREVARPTGAVTLPERLFTPVLWPASRTLHLRAIGERVPVYEKHVRLVREFTVPSDELLRLITDNTGTLVLTGTLHYQACDATNCYNPESVPLRFELQLLRHDMQRVPEPLRRPSPRP
jgi:hypothetical protein